MKAIAPGKIILSGEHAVVYGAPAIAIAVRKYARVETVPCDDALVRVRTPFGAGCVASLEEANARARDVQARYEAFLDGELPIADVMPHKQQFVELGWSLFHGREPEEQPRGASITASSELPLGSGMGSSAAIAAALFTSLAAFYRQELDADTCFELALALESFQHGHPSGVDPYLAAHGGAVRYRRECPPEELELSAHDLCIVHTGAPTSTTGECVARVRETHEKSMLWSEFETVCHQLQLGLTAENPMELITAIRANHQLLVEIGVVPTAIQELVSRIEERGGAAKICGAGSIRGDAAGIVWVVGEKARAALPEFGYTPMSLEGDPHGARIVR